MARSIVAHTWSGTPCGRRSGTGALAIRASIGTSVSSAAATNAAPPASAAKSVEASA
jgi:hypothetical protein